MIEVIKYPGDDEEIIDADESAGKSEKIKVKENDGQDRERAQAVKVRTVGKFPL